jgi:type IV secretory pathway TrbD component
MSRLFLPTARQANWLLIIGFLSIGYALYLRYMVIEQSGASLACEAGLQTWLCATRRLTIWLFNHSVFGWVALAAAGLNLVRPSLLLFALGIAAAGIGIVLYNVGLSALAVALLVLSLARRVREAI